MIQLSDHFNYKRLLRFTLPSIIMLIFTSVYGVVDGSAGRGNIDQHGEKLVGLFLMAGTHGDGDQGAASCAEQETDAA